MLLVESILKENPQNIQSFKNTKVLLSMLQVSNYIPKNSKTNENIFDFAVKGTIERAIFDDDVESLRGFLHIDTSEKIKSSRIRISEFYSLNFVTDTFGFDKHEISLYECAALFGSLKCFKYLVMNRNEIDDDVFKFACAGNNYEIVHL